MSLVHQYITPINTEEVKKIFLQNPQKKINFLYKTNQPNTFDVFSPRDKQLYQASRLLIDENTLKNQKNFIKINKELFGKIQTKYVYYLLDFFYFKSKNSSKNTQLWYEIASMLDLKSDKSITLLNTLGPQAKTFNTYKKYFIKYIGQPQLNELKNLNLYNSVDFLLNNHGLKQKGWRIVYKHHDASRARVNYEKKCIIIGKEYKLRRSNSASKIAIHEVLGHALRGKVGTLADREGFAILLEQLLEKKFYFLRSYRYLAAAIASGAVNAPKDFYQTHEILWRIMMIGSKYSKQKAQSYAFDECVRVFRGTNCDASGAVFLKDSVYFVANIKLWDKLEEKSPTYSQFVDILEGRKKIL